MKFIYAEKIDNSFGHILVKFISLLPPYPKKITTDANFENLLILKFWGLGSILEATPMIRALKQHYSNVPLDMLTFEENKHLVESFGLFRNVHTIDLRKGLFNFIFQTIRFILVHRRKYSLIIDLEFFAYFSALVTKLLASKFTLGFESFIVSRNRCYSRTVIFDHSNHVRTIFLKFLYALSITNENNIVLSVPKISEEKKLSTIKKVPSLLKNKQIKIGININVSELCVFRRWPIENFRKLIDFMQHDFLDFQIYLIGGKNDISVVNSFYDSLPEKKNIYNIAGKLDILESSFALSRMDCLISSDSGPVHIAEAMDIPIVSFYGPETPNLYGTLSKKSLIFYKNLFCSPCLNTYNHKRSTCKDNQCLKHITPEEVYEKMKSKYFTSKFYETVTP